MALSPNDDKRIILDEGIHKGALAAGITWLVTAWQRHVGEQAFKHPSLNKAF